MKKLAQGFNTAAQDSNPGPLSRESGALPLSNCTLQSGSKPAHEAVPLLGHRLLTTTVCFILSVAFASCGKHPAATHLLSPFYAAVSVGHELIAVCAASHA